MKVLYLTQYFFSPEQAGGSRHYYHVKHLTASGHKVDVLTSYVQDHMSRTISPKYKGKFFAKEYCEDIPVYKTFATANYGQSFLDRIKNYLSFMVCAVLTGFKLPGRYDIVFASSPSLFVGLAGFILSRLKKSKFVLEVRDLWPKSAVELGFLKNKALIKLTEWLERFLYRKAAGVIAVTGGIKAAVEKAVGNPDRVTLITNGVDTDFFQTSWEIDFKNKHGLQDNFVVIYVGSHGINNDLETIIEAAGKLTTVKEIHFAFFGGGDHKDYLIRLCMERGLKNVSFFPPQPKNTVSSLLQGADVCVLAIKKRPFFQGTLPNKIFDYLASGKPVVAAVPPDGETAELLRKFHGGIVCEAENSKAVAAAIESLFRDQELYRSFQDQARDQVREDFSRTRLAGVLEQTLKKVLEQDGHV